MILMFNLRFEKKIFLAVVTVILLTGVSSFGLAYAPSADVFAGLVGCPEENKSVFATQNLVYIFGSNLPDGNYYVRVTETGGDTLGTSTVTVTVSGGTLACTQLVSIVFKESNGSIPGWDESIKNINYKIKISEDNTFPNGGSLEFDGFKVASATSQDTSITLVKIVNNNYGGNNDENSFGLTVDGVPVDSGEIVPATPGVPVIIDENTGTGYSLFGITGTGCPQTLPGTVTPTSGQQIICEITNEDIQPTITLTKIVDSIWGTEEPDDFLLTIDGNSATSTIQYLVNSNTQISIGETLKYGYVLDNITGDDCPATLTGPNPITAQVTLDEGQDLSCTITNKDTRGKLIVKKFYDVNANGEYDSLTDLLIDDWVFSKDGTLYYTPMTFLLIPGIYPVTESLPLESNWIKTYPTSSATLYPEVKTDDITHAKFGNLCVGPGGGMTLGFWSNKNGQALYGLDDNNMIISLNLKNGGGADFDPAASPPALLSTSKSQFRTWILSATAKNMGYMLSAQLAAMELNVLNGKVNGESLIYAPGTTSANSLGFATVNAIMSEANNELGAHPYTVSPNQYRSYQEALKNALDDANNNKNFVQPTVCPFTFSEYPAP